MPHEGLKDPLAAPFRSEAPRSEPHVRPRRSPLPGAW